MPSEILSVQEKAKLNNLELLIVTTLESYDAGSTKNFFSMYIKDIPELARDVIAQVRKSGATC